MTLNHNLFALLGSGTLLVASTGQAPAERPNILWITSEDNSPFLGCYGDPLAQTPHLDKLAAQGVRYTRAFANSPVCSPARTALLLGMHPVSLGVQNHRAQRAIPDSIKTYPELLRAAGYYCTNNAKKDYNVKLAGRTLWDESSTTAHYKNRPDGKPFFAVFNIFDTHASQSFPKEVEARREAGLVPKIPRLKPEEIRLPPYHPDLPEVREAWVDFYDCLTAMDKRVGELLDELEASGLADDTIVIYSSDHGGPLPRGKLSLLDSGTRVPLIVRFPEKWKHLAPAAPGESVDRLVSFVDFAPTFLSLVGAPAMEAMQGRAFLGPDTGPPADRVFLYRDRIDMRADPARSIRTDRFRYVRNYFTQYSPAQYYTYLEENCQLQAAWRKHYEAGKCNPVQSHQFELKEPEWLFDLENDPHEIRNLAGDPGYADVLEELREALDREMLAARDVGLIPEEDYDLIGETTTLRDYGSSDRYPLEHIMEIASKASRKNPDYLGDFLEAMEDPHSVVRYWGAMGCVILGGAAGDAATGPLEALLSDENAAARIAAAWALLRRAPHVEAATVLSNAINSEVEWIRLAALRVMEDSPEALRLSESKIRKLASMSQGADQSLWQARYLVEQRLDR